MTRQKLDNLRNYFKKMGRVIVAYSGGVDSTFLAKVATDTLGENALCVTGDSATYTKTELNNAIEMAKSLGFNHRILTTRELEDELFSANPPERCYYCKKELMSKLQQLAEAEGFSHVVEGANVDDLQDFRPGSKACREIGVFSPLQEVGLTKVEIRELSQELGLPTWNKPSMACLASRIPYGTKITRQALDKIGQSEKFLSSLGFSPVRVRNYGETARIELDPSQFTMALSPMREEIIRHLKSFGFTYITLDLGGLRSGSMNEVLNKERK